MRFLKKLSTWIALILIIGGAAVLLFTYMSNKSAIAIVMADPAVKALAGIFSRMAWCAGAIIAGLIFLSISFKIGAGIRSREKEKEKAELEARKAEEARASHADQHEEEIRG